MEAKKKTARVFSTETLKQEPTYTKTTKLKSSMKSAACWFNLVLFFFLGGGMETIYLSTEVPELCEGIYISIYIGIILFSYN